MAEHHVSVTVNAPVHQVYTLFTHFNDFPKFMSFVKEVTYYDDQRSHWVAQILGRHEWDAINENWIEDRQIGWRSTSGPENTGKVKFLSTGPNETLVDVYRSEEHTSELQSQSNLVCRLLLVKKQRPRPGLVIDSDEKLIIANVRILRFVAKLRRKFRVAPINIWKVTAQKRLAPRTPYRSSQV